MSPSCAGDIRAKELLPEEGLACFKPCRRAALATSLSQRMQKRSHRVSSHVAELRWRHRRIVVIEETKPIGFQAMSPSCAGDISRLTHFMRRNDKFQAMSPSCAGDIRSPPLPPPRACRCFKPCRRAALATSLLPLECNRGKEGFKPCRRAALATSRSERRCGPGK